MEKYTIVKTKRVPIKGAREMKARLLEALGADPAAYRWEAYDKSFVLIGDRDRYTGKNGKARWSMR
jgi:hypothetical protein